MDDLDLAVAAARAGAAVITESSGDLGVEFKGDVDPVTVVDRAAEDAILSMIRAHRPDDDVLAEESGGADSAGRQWIVDPIDGTVNFVNGIDHYAVSVGLWADGRPLVGVIVDVGRDRTYAAERGAGAEVDGRRLAVTADGPADAIVATGFPYDRRHRAEAYGSLVARLLAEVRGVRRFGSAALDLAWVAEGRLDGYVETGLGPWDIAAGLLLVTEAGGVVVDEAGNPAHLRSRAFAAGNPVVAGRLAQLVAPALD